MISLKLITPSWTQRLTHSTRLIFSWVCQVNVGIENGPFAKDVEHTERLLLEINHLYDSEFFHKLSKSDLVCEPLFLFLI